MWEIEKVLVTNISPLPTTLSTQSKKIQNFLVTIILSPANVLNSDRLKFVIW